MNNYNSFVYKWTDHLTGMFYVGCKKGIPDNKYICSSKIMKPIYMERPDTFTREILSYHNTFEDARKEEIRLLTEVNAARNPLYYNRCNGGAKGFHAADRKVNHSEKTRKKMKHSSTGRKHSEETKAKMSIDRQGKIPWNKGIPMSVRQKEKLRISKTGKKQSIEARKKNSESNSGDKNHFYGKTHSEESKKKMSDSLIGNGKGVPKSEEHKKNMSIAQKHRYSKSK